MIKSLMLCVCVCMCMCVVCVKGLFFFIVGAVFISHLLKMLNRGIEVRGYYRQAYTGSQ